MILGPSKKKRKKIIIIASRFDLDPLLQMLSCIWEIYTHSNTSELTVAQQNVVTEVDNLYIQVDPEDDPDKFDPCATSEPELDTEDLETAIAGL
jgi:hypothetical protein